MSTGEQRVKRGVRQWPTGLALALSLVSALQPFLQPQYWQLRRVRRHIAEITPQWSEFKRANPGFAGVEFFPTNDFAWGVMLAAGGRISPDVERMQLTDFMWSTKPPRSVDVSAVSTDLSGMARTPVTMKVPVLTTDGRRMEVEVAAEPYSGIRRGPGRSRVEPGPSTHGSPPTSSATDRATRTEGENR